MENNLIILKAEKKKVPYGYSTIIYNSDNTIKAIFPVNQRQPRKGQKTIMINCWKFALEWV